jgi:S-adenosylmethionine/arginine decarboxylase-like enzyme
MAKNGRELSMWGWCTNRDVLADQQRMLNLLSDICYLVGMTSLKELSVDVPVQVSKLGREPFEDEGGTSAAIILSTSHLAIHGWPRRDDQRADGGYFMMNLQSCRDFDPSIINEFVAFALNASDFQAIDRIMVEP